MAPPRRIRQARYWLTAAVLLGALVGGLVWVQARGSARNVGPLEGHLLSEPVRFDGRVAERLDAGSYAYLRVTRDGSGDAWVVAVRPRVRAGDRIHVDAMGRAEGFTSKRLGRRFDELWFAAVRTLD